MHALQVLLTKHHNIFSKLKKRVTLCVSHPSGARDRDLADDGSEASVAASPAKREFVSDASILCSEDWDYGRGNSNILLLTLDPVIMRKRHIDVE